MLALRHDLSAAVSYRPGTRLPMFVWAYPQEFTDADAASQVVGSAEPIPDRRRRLAPAAAHAGLRDLRRSDDADRRRG